MVPTVLIACRQFLPYWQNKLILPQRLQVWIRVPDTFAHFNNTLICIRVRVAFVIWVPYRCYNDHLSYFVRWFWSRSSVKNYAGSVIRHLICSLEHCSLWFTILWLCEGLDMSGPRREDEPEWGVLTYNLALAKFQQRHILQVIFLLPLLCRWREKYWFRHRCGAGAEFTNYGSGSLPFNQRLEEI